MKEKSFSVFKVGSATKKFVLFEGWIFNLHLLYHTETFNELVDRGIFCVLLLYIYFFIFKFYFKNVMFENPAH